MEYMSPKYDTSCPGRPLADDQKIPSELIEGHIKRFFMIQIESLAYGMTKPEKVRRDLEGLAFFVRCSCGIHASLATSNEVDRLSRLTDEQLINIAKKTFEVDGKEK